MTLHTPLSRTDVGLIEGRCEVDCVSEPFPLAPGEYWIKLALSSMGGADSIVEKKKPAVADEALFFAPVPKAVCGPGDNPETALQGQVPAAMRAAK